MAKTSFILRALSLLGLEEILKLSEVLAEKQAPIKKAAGEDLIVWDEAPKKKPVPREEAKVLAFPKPQSISNYDKLSADKTPLAAEADSDKQEETRPNLIHSDLVLWQREISKEVGGNTKKLDAVQGYQKSTQMYVVKTEDAEGKKKLRFASTDGVLVNKKQA